MRMPPFAIRPALHLGALAAFSALSIADDRPRMNPWRGYREPKKRRNPNREIQAAAKRARKTTRRNRK